MFAFPDTTLTITDAASVISSAQPLLCLSSAVVGGGFTHTRTILNRHVLRDYNCADPVSDLEQFARTLLISGPFVGMMTGVPMHGTRVVQKHYANLTVASIITAGVGNAVTSGVTSPVPFVPGTINITVLIDAQLVPAALVNAVITATEAKTSVLTACAVRSADGDLATGTSTDALVLACTGRGKPLVYAGPGTEVGYLIGSSVREGLNQALEPCGIFYPARLQDPEGDFDVRANA